MASEESTVDRFWSKADQGDDDECWEWQGATTSSGYGNFSWQGSRELAHRMAFKLSTGREIDEFVLHHCDNKLCINPSHLYEGTHQQNMNDAIERDRFPSGEEHYCAKLTKKDVEEIRSRGGEETHSDLADEFGVDPSQITRIINGEEWSE